MRTIETEKAEKRQKQANNSVFHNAGFLVRNEQRRSERISFCTSIAEPGEINIPFKF